MALEAGTKLGHYEVVSSLGAGGMGEVYRAKDTKLGREVAIKLLLDEVSEDADRLARFEREAKVLAGLKHPNIATLYSFEAAGGTRFLVMEVAEGETLEKLLEKGALPIARALEIGSQIGAAIDAAHKAEIVHRDLKPGNVMLTKTGVKVLDFGLAKSIEPEPQAANTQSPTRMQPITGQGSILGTQLYMAPEQLEGKDTDARTDIWALGCVLYEMITGERPFQGDNQASLTTAIMASEPRPLSVVQELAPRRLDWVVSRCLAKDPERRWQSALDVGIELQAVGDDAADAEEPGAHSQTATRTRSPSGLTWGIAFALGVLVAGFAAWNFATDRSVYSPTVRFSFDVPLGANQGIGSGVDGPIAISPDGSRIAYLSTRVAPSGEEGREPVRQIFVRAMAEGEGTLLAGTEGAQDLFFSPNGAWVGFTANGKLQRVPVGGGAPLDIASVGPVYGVAWGPDDLIIFGNGIPSGLVQVSLTGGAPRPLTIPDPGGGQIAHGHPEFLPDGTTVLFAIGTKDGSRIARLSLDTGDWVDLGLSGSEPRYLSPGYIAFTQNGNLRLVSFDLDTLEMGRIQTAEDGIAAGNSAGLEHASFDLSPTGDLVFVQGTMGLERQPAWVDREGHETLIDAPLGLYFDLQISPAGDRLATSRTDAHGIGKVWVMNIDGSGAFPVGEDEIEYNPAWRPDGETLTYTVNGDMFEKRVDEDAVRTEVLLRDNYQMPRSWSPDGESLAFREVSADGSRIWVLPRGGLPEPLTDATYDAASPKFAPQGGWIVYSSDETGQSEVWVRRYPGTERAEQISQGGGSQPVWSSTGDELYYRVRDRMMAVEIETEPELLHDEPIELWSHPYFSQEDHFPNYDVARDGRFLMLAIPEVEETETMTITVVLNWLEELKRLVPTD